jgi:hypothetical protein
MPFDVAAALKERIARENDEARRTDLMLLLGVFEANLAGLERISKKIDDLISDEQSLRLTVLNGHAKDHDKHHEWIEQRMQSSCSDACEWAERKMAEERQAEIEAKETARADKRAARDALIRQGIVILLTVAATATGTMFVLK